MEMKTAPRKMDVIQIGCHTGNDGFFDFFDAKHKEINKCLMVEPLLSSLELCRQRYAEKFNSETLNKISFINKAVIDEPGRGAVDFFFPKGEHATEGDVHHTEFSSTDINQLICHGVTEIEKREVPAITLSKLCAQWGLEKVDRLYLDAEGLDVRILLSMDLSEIDIPFICFEAAHSDGPFQQAENCWQVDTHLIENGYEIYTFSHLEQRGPIVHSSYDYNLWALKGDQESLQKEVAEFAGYKSRIAKGTSVLLQRKRD